MSTVPKIAGPADAQDFHDSSLVDFWISPYLDIVEIIVSTPDINLIERLWQIRCEGVLKFEYETLGDGHLVQGTPPLEIYEIYNDENSGERHRWISRLINLGINRSEANKIFHLVLASSFIRGWGENDYIEGINIVCRWVIVRQAPEKYKGFEYSRPRIEGAPDE